MAIPTNSQLEGSTWEPDSGIVSQATDGGTFRTIRRYDVDLWRGSMMYSLTAAEMRALQVVYDADPDATHTGFVFEGDYNSPQSTYAVKMLNRPHGTLNAGRYDVTLELIGTEE